MSVKPFHERVFDVVKRIPRGRVASYKLVATMAGSPGAARQCGRVMRLAKGSPWWRVLTQEGRIAIQNPELRFEQMSRLEAEGIAVSEAGFVDYERFSWKPSSRSKTAARARPSARARSPARRAR